MRKCLVEIIVKIFLEKDLWIRKIVNQTKNIPSAWSAGRMCPVLAGRAVRSNEFNYTVPESDTHLFGGITNVHFHTNNVCHTSPWCPNITIGQVPIKSMKGTDFCCQVSLMPFIQAVAATNSGATAAEAAVAGPLLRASGFVFISFSSWKYTTSIYLRKRLDLHKAIDHSIDKWSDSRKEREEVKFVFIFHTIFYSASFLVRSFLCFFFVIVTQYPISDSIFLFFYGIHDYYPHSLSWCRTCFRVRKWHEWHC